MHVVGYTICGKTIDKWVHGALSLLSVTWFYVIFNTLLQPSYNLFEEVASYGVCKNLQPLAMACWLSIFEISNEILRLEAFMYFYVYTCKMKDSFISTAFICCCVDPNEVLNPRERCNKQAWHSKVTRTKHVV